MRRLFNGHTPNAAKRIITRDGQRVTECLLDNRCLACSGGCEGYERTVEEMRAARAEYQQAKAETRHRFEANRARRLAREV